MSVGDEDAVNAPEGLRQDLLTEVGAAIHQQPRRLCLYQNGTARALVFSVAALAHLALATYHRHTTRRARTQKRNLHLYDVYFWLNVYAKLLTHIATDGLAQGHDLAPRGAPPVHE